MANETILIVDDEADIRDLIQLYLQQKEYQAFQASNGDQALQLVDTALPDLILLDIEMPGENGFEICKQIRKKMTVPIIFLSVRRELMDKIKCFELGGDDYVTKPFNFAELEARMKAILRRYKKGEQQKQNDHILKYDCLEIDKHKCKCFFDGQPVALSTKEFQLLMHLAEHPNKVWSSDQLYDQIWDLDSTGNIQTVKVHIRNLRRKLEKDPANPNFIQTVRGFGYRFTY